MTDESFEAWWTRFSKGSDVIRDNLGVKEIARAAWEAAMENARNQRKLVH